MVGDQRRAASVNMPELDRSEEHTSELQSQSKLVCRLLLEKTNAAADLQEHRILRGRLPPGGEDESSGSGALRKGRGEAEPFRQRAVDALDDLFHPAGGTPA